jgi:hypothetical protein
MSNPGPETRLVKRMIAAILKAYPTAWVIKSHGGPYQETGLPDIFVVVEGRFVGIEAKAPEPGESDERILRRVTPKQRLQLDRLTRAGAVAGCAWTVDGAVELVRQAVAGTSSEGGTLT